MVRKLLINRFLLDTLCPLGDFERLFSLLGLEHELVLGLIHLRHRTLQFSSQNQRRQEDEEQLSQPDLFDNHSPLFVRSISFQPLFAL
jgi:hypothetical protein